MTRTGRFAAAVLAGLAVVATGLPAFAAEGKVKKPDVKKRRVSIFVDGTGCGFEVEPKPLSIKKEKAELLGLRIKNDCGFEQKAIVCAFDADGRSANPFDACTSTPAGLGLGTAVKLAASGSTADIDCTPGAPGKYSVLLMVAGQVPAACPATPPKESIPPMGDVVRNHRLELEILP